MSAAPELVDAVLGLDDARALTARIRGHLEAATVDLIAAWRGRVWLPLGHPTWDAYLEAEFGDLLRIQLAAPVRRERVVAMRLEGMSARAIAPALGVKKSTVASDLAHPDVVDRVQLAQIVSLDGRRRPSATPAIGGVTEPAASAPTSVDRAVAAVARAGADGLTVHEAERRLRWRQGQTSCALSRAEKRGRLVRTGRFRDGCAVYVTA